MRKLFVILALIVVAFVPVSLSAQGSAALQNAYATWRATQIGSGMSWHYYLAAQGRSLGNGNIAIDLGLGGQMPQYRVTLRAVAVHAMPGGDLVLGDGGNVSPVGDPMTIVGQHSTGGGTAGTFSSASMMFATPAGANAVQVTLVPLGFTDIESPAHLLIPIGNLTGETYSDIGVEIGTPKCPDSCKIVSGTCSGRCGKLGPICCTGVSSFLDCVNCNITCGSGTLCPAVVTPGTGTSVTPVAPGTEND